MTKAGVDKMNLTVSEKAAKWYKEELHLDNELHSIRFFVRYGGVGGLLPGLSLGIKADTPSSPLDQDEVLGLIFFIEDEDDWYFDGHDLFVGFDEMLGEPSFEYK